MSEYTPTTEDVQDIYGTHPTHVEEFYRWLNAHDAEVAAKTLEDAADAFMRETDDPDECTTTFYAHEIEYWLRARAAEIREGA